MRQSILTVLGRIVLRIVLLKFCLPYLLHELIHLADLLIYKVPSANVTKW